MKMTQFIVQGYPAYAYTGGRPFDPGLPTVVFVHGAAFDHSVWQWQSRYLAHHGRSVLAVDLPAHGRSPGALRESIEQWAEWLPAFIDAAGGPQAPPLRPPPWPPVLRFPPRSRPPPPSRPSPAGHRPPASA